LKELVTLRISGNSIKLVPPLISCLSKLETLVLFESISILYQSYSSKQALDNNEIGEFPEGITKLPHLKHLWLR
jgi:hypothetical protein